MSEYKSKLTTAQMAMLLLLFSHETSDVTAHGELFRKDHEIKGLVSNGYINADLTLTDKGTALAEAVMQTSVKQIWVQEE